MVLPVGDQDPKWTVAVKCCVTYEALGQRGSVRPSWVPALFSPPVPCTILPLASCTVQPPCTSIAWHFPAKSPGPAGPVTELWHLLLQFSCPQRSGPVWAFFPACEFALVISSKTHGFMRVWARVARGSLGDRPPPALQPLSLG